MTESTARVVFAAAPAAPAKPGRSLPAAGGGAVAPSSPAAVVVATRPAPGTGLVSRPTTIRRPTQRPTDSSFLARLARLLRLGRIRLGQLNAEDLRVLVILAIALIVALGGRIDLAAPAPVEAPDALPSALAAARAPSAAPASGGMVDDPTSSGQITVTTAHGLASIRAEFGPVLRSESCWDAHAWNPRSDHPLGKACDFWVSPAKQFAGGADLAAGNRIVAWLREYAGELGVAYVIWQGRIWSPERGDRPYNGGGVYDPTDATGGHFDHIHVSFAR